MDTKAELTVTHSLLHNKPLAALRSQALTAEVSHDRSVVVTSFH